MNLHDNEREQSVSLIKAALAPDRGVDQRHRLDKGDLPGHPFRGNQHSAGLQEGKISEGMRVVATARYGGKSGTIVDPRDGKSFVVVRHDDGTKASYHYSDLLHAEDDEDDVDKVSKGDLPGHEFRGNQHTGGGGGKNGNTGTIRPKKWDGVEQLKAGHIVNLIGDDAFEHVVLEAQDERGDMPRVLVAALGTGMSIAPTERVDRTFVRPAASVEAVRAKFMQEAAKDAGTKASTARTITMNALAQRAGFSNAQQAYAVLSGTKKDLSLSKPGAK